MNLEAYIRIIRPIVCIQVAALAIVGSILTAKGLPESLTLIKSFSSAFLLAASIHTSNDYIDYEIDSVNTPWRPIPSGKMSRSEALYFAVALGLLGLAISLSLSPLAAILAVLIFALTNYYSIKAKVYGFIGHVIVAFCYASYFLLGALNVTTQIEPYIINIYALSVIYILAGEIIQSIADAEGDKIRGVKTIVLTNGPKTAAIIAAVCYISMSFLGAYTILQFGTSFEPLITAVIILITCLFVGVIMLPLLMNPEKEVAFKTRNRLNTTGLVLILGFLVYLLV
jgi:geranylgeranylglycerol-phosphate geranylgeranyltransferase